MDAATAHRLIERLNADAQQIARRFGLRYRSITAERAGVKSRYGVCYADGAIRIRLRHATTGRPLKYSSLVNTLCHELAHLRHFHHGPRFRAFYLEILEHARALGIYRPRRLLHSSPGLAPPPLARRPAAAQRTRTAAQSGPTQLSLFGKEADSVGRRAARRSRAKAGPCAG